MQSNRAREIHGGCSQEEEVQDEDAQPSGWRMEARCSGAERLSPLRCSKAASHGLPVVRLVQGPRRRRRRL